MHAIPPSISNLIHLQTLNLSHCPLLESLPGPMGELPVLKSMKSYCYHKHNYYCCFRRDVIASTSRIMCSSDDIYIYKNKFCFYVQISRVRAVKFVVLKPEKDFEVYEPWCKMHCVVRRIE